MYLKCTVSSTEYMLHESFFISVLKDLEVKKRGE